MKNVFTTPVADGITRREGLLTLLGSALALAGCGGGGGVAGLSSGGTGSFSVGPITGFGSIIVGLIRFEDSTANSVLDIDDDNNDMRGKLKLGMVVRVKGKPKNGIRADADSIEVRSELLGPIDSVDTTAKTLLVLGQTVQVTATTVFEDGLTGLSALVVGNIVEVHGFVDPLSNRLTATRIERKDPAKVKAFKLQGFVKLLDATAKTFKIDTLTINFAASVNTPANLVFANDMLVRVRLASTQTTGTRTALKVHVVKVEVEDRDEAEVEGTITEFTSSSNFKVNGLQVNASNVSVPAGLKLGDRVEVEGSLVNGVLVAKKVELEVENDQFKFELHGTVSGLTLTTFVVRGVTVNYTISVIDGVIEKLKDLASVEVKGVVSTDGTKVNATRITFE
nr:DUF5666 domain-containing protein [Rhodoferax sp.]